jgi:hypothetical protein
MILLFSTDLTETTPPEIGDGSYLKLTKCEEGWFALSNHKDLIDSFDWAYTEVESITPLTIEL